MVGETRTVNTAGPVLVTVAKVGTEVAVDGPWRVWRMEAAVGVTRGGGVASAAGVWVVTGAGGVGVAGAGASGKDRVRSRAKVPDGE